ncbi:hypothetical protein [Amniculibacterium aquaticum]|uniref:hypothetical protein n=1 Tax=Amniculibacterium aquaticum TaxID=2479858 RepID=UPI0013DE06DB|nr:hypothetical protein [Amniculibacterium aquaticum]
MNKIITILGLFYSVMFFSQESLKVEYEIVTQSKINWNGFENMKDSYKEEIKRQIKQNDEIPVKYTLNLFNVS